MTGQKTAYVIDDEPNIRQQVAQKLEEAGYQVQVFKTVDAALEHMGHDRGSRTVAQNLPTVVVTDNETGLLSYTGLYLAEVLNKSGVACVLMSGSSSAVSEASRFHAQSICKWEGFESEVAGLAKKAIEQIMLKKLDLPQVQGGLAK